MIAVSTILCAQTLSNSSVLTSCNEITIPPPTGGPLIMKGSDATKDVQVGVSSWGYGCASPDFPGV